MTVYPIRLARHATLDDLSDTRHDPHGPNVQFAPVGHLFNDAARQLIAQICKPDYEGRNHQLFRIGFGAGVTTPPVPHETSADYLRHCPRDQLDALKVGIGAVCTKLRSVFEMKVGEYKSGRVVMESYGGALDIHPDSTDYAATVELSGNDRGTIFFNGWDSADEAYNNQIFEDLMRKYGGGPPYEVITAPSMQLAVFNGLRSEAPVWHCSSDGKRLILVIQ